MTVVDMLPAGAPDRESPFNVVLGIWASWMTLKDQQHSQGCDHEQDAKDFMSVGLAVDTMINSLPRVQWWAVRRVRGIATVWIFPDLSLLDAMADAETTLTPKMQNNLATRRYFN